MLAELEQASGGLWPYLVVILVGFLPTEIWRVMGVMAARNIDEQAEILVWVRLVAAALVAGVVAKLLLSPSGALAVLPLWLRASALLAGCMAFAATRRNVLLSLLVGEVVLIAGGLLWR